MTREEAQRMARFWRHVQLAAKYAALIAFAIGLCGVTPAY